MNRIDTAENRVRIINKESFLIVAGRRLGKTYFMCEMGTHLTKQGHNVCLLTPDKKLPRFTNITRVYHHYKALLNVPYDFDYIFLDSPLMYMNHIDRIKKKYSYSTIIMTDGAFFYERYKRPWLMEKDTTTYIK